MQPTAILRAKTIATVDMAEHGQPSWPITLGPGEFVGYVARVSNPDNQMNKETYPKLMAYLQKARHWSPFEMSNAVIEIHTTRDIAHQILRHVSNRFQEFSQRYAEVKDFHYDFVARRQDTKNRQNSIADMSEDDIQWFFGAQKMVVDLTTDLYKEALRRGIAKELARKVLPEGLTGTTLYMNGSLRSWTHYLAERLHEGTQKEHRDVAIACQAELKKHIPEVFDLGVEP